MAIKKTASILDQLAAQKSALVSNAENNLGQATYFESQVSVLRDSAAADNKKAAAIAEATSILEKAGVTV